MAVHLSWVQLSVLAAEAAEAASHRRGLTPVRLVALAEAIKITLLGYSRV